MAEALNSPKKLLNLGHAGQKEDSPVILRHLRFKRCIEDVGEIKRGNPRKLSNMLAAKQFTTFPVA